MNRQPQGACRRQREFGHRQARVPAHPRLQHVVVAQGLGLAGEFALVTGGHTSVARDPVHGPREALEEVGAVVVGSTLLFSEGQCCKGDGHSQGLALQSPQLTPLSGGQWRDRS